MKQESLGKEIIRLALPATVENIFQTLVGFVDTLLIAQLGLVAVTAVGLANTILNVYLAVYMALGVGATALIARSIGAGDRESLAFHVRQALVLSVGVGSAIWFTIPCFWTADAGLNGSRCGEFGWRPGIFLLGWWFDDFSGLDDHFGNNLAGIWGYSISYENELTDQWF